MLWEQRQCMRFSQPKDHIIFDSDASRVPGLANLAGYHVVNGTGAIVSTEADRHCNELGVLAGKLEQLEAFRNPEGDCWHEALFGHPGARQGLFSGGAPPDSTFVVFSHRLCAGGDDRLVVVFAEWWAPPSGLNKSETDELSFRTEIIIPSSLFGAPARKEGACVQGSRRIVRLYDPSHLTIFAGQPDPADASRFTIEFATPAGRGFLRGNLRPDESVDIVVAGDRPGWPGGP